MDVLLSQLNDITECGICTETLRDPRLLPCVHTFCFDCLRRLLGAVENTEKKLVCPLCRSEFRVPTGGLDALQRNFFMKQLIEAMKNSREEVVTRGNVHQTQNCTTSPGSKPVVAQSGERTPLTLCRKHRLYELCLNCEDCKGLLCSRCFDKDHRLHRSSNLKEIGEELRKRIHE